MSGQSSPIPNPQKPEGAPLGPSPHPGRRQGRWVWPALWQLGRQLSARLSVPAPAGQLGPNATPHPMTQQKAKTESAPAGCDPVLTVSPEKLPPEGTDGTLLPEPGMGWPV